MFFILRCFLASLLMFAFTANLHAGADKNNVYETVIRLTSIIYSNYDENGDQNISVKNLLNFQDWKDADPVTKACTADKNYYYYAKINNVPVYGCKMDFEEIIKLLKLKSDDVNISYECFFGYGRVTSYSQPSNMWMNYLAGWYSTMIARGSTHFTPKKVITNAEGTIFIKDEFNKKYQFINQGIVCPIPDYKL